METIYDAFWVTFVAPLIIGLLMMVVVLPFMGLQWLWHRLFGDPDA